MNAPFHPDVTSLDLLAVGTKARVASVDWAALDEGEACRLRHFGFDEGVTVEPLHLGPFGRDPIAIRVGRMTVAIRRRHAGAIRVQPIQAQPIR
jgi:ferrous iron transport protein A